MPINIDPVLASQPKTMKDAIDKIARNGQSLQNPSRGGALYVAAVPGVADLSEGEEVYYINGATIRKYTKLNNTIRYWNLT